MLSGMRDRGGHIAQRGLRATAVNRSVLGSRAATSFRPWLMRQVAMCSKGKDPPQTYATGTCTEDKSIA